jgi:hypothetical protein
VLTSLLPTLPLFPYASVKQEEILWSYEGLTETAVRPSSMVVSSSRSNDAGMRRDANTARFEVAAICKAHGVRNLLPRGRKN